MRNFIILKYLLLVFAVVLNSHSVKARVTCSAGSSTGSGYTALKNAGADTSWGPLVGPWTRYKENPIIRLEGKETYSIQNGPQSVIKWKGRWYMFLMTSDVMGGEL